MKLSIIIPYYNTKREYTDELLDILAPQMVDSVECVLVDDGSKVPYKTKYDWCRIIYQKNGGTAVARNTGIDNTTGEYISFIDSDDTVAPYFVEKILHKIDTEHFDFLEMSWKSHPEGGAQYCMKLNSIDDHLHNPSVCHRVFKRSFIGDFRFNPTKISGEDEEFSRKIGYDRGKRAVETEFMCFYRTYVENSKFKRFVNGEMRTKRILYSYNRITKGMHWLVDEIKEEDKFNQVYVIANECELTEELSKYARVHVPPIKIRAHELRGDPTPYYVELSMNTNFQIVLYTSKLNKIGGIETFTYNFCKNMHNKYSILVAYDTIDKEQYNRLMKYVRCEDINKLKDITCNTLIMNKIGDKIPPNIDYIQSVQVVHACNGVYNVSMPKDRDRYIFVSNTVKNSWNMEGDVINNFCIVDDVKESLLLVTATRFSTREKGQDRMIKLANLMNEKNIPFIWLYFSDKEIEGCPFNLIHVNPTLDILPYIKKADYLVQLSDSEGYGYSMVEALREGTPLIVTDIPVLKEIGVNESNAHIIPLNIPDDLDVSKFYTDRKIHEIEHDSFTPEIESAWSKVLDNIANNALVRVEITRRYKDLEFGRIIDAGERIKVKYERAKQIVDAGIGKML